MFIGYQVTVVARGILSRSGVTWILECLFADVVCFTMAWLLWHVHSNIWSKLRIFRCCLFVRWTVIYKSVSNCFGNSIATFQTLLFAIFIGQKDSQCFFGLCNCSLWGLVISFCYDCIQLVLLFVQTRLTNNLVY